MGSVLFSAECVEFEPSIKWDKLLSKFISLNFVNDDFRKKRKRNKTTHTIVKYASISYINKDV